jgi:gliding motility-associated-like protein
LISNSSPVICFGDTTGTISVTCIGGTPPYTVSNSINTYPGNPAFFPDVFAGPDVMLVVDANQCFVTIPYVMNQPAAPLSHTISSINNITCPPSIDGTISLDVNGGWPTNNIIYNYKLFNAANNLLFDQNNNGVFGNIPEGGYYIHITDSMGCVDTVSFSIVGPDTALSISVDILNNVSCNGDSSGYVLFGANGGYPGYQYFINSNPVTNGIGNNLPPGSHVLSVTDANGCSKDTIIDITEPDLLQLNLISQDSVKCFGACNGKISIQASGGTPPYTYTLNGITSNNNGLFNQLCAGIYQVVVSDARGCTTTFNHTMFQPLAPLTALQVINDSVTCYGGSNGLLYIQASGGTPAYQYSLTGQVSGNTAANNNGVFSGLIADDYDVVATDANLCTFTNTFTIGQANLPLQLTVSGTQNVICNGDTTGHICFLAAGGTLPYSFVCLDNGLVQPEGILGSGPCFYGLNSGSYSISVTDFNGCSVTQQANITQPATPIQATASVSQVKCYSGSDGIIAVNTVGGTPGYTFAINTSPFNFSPISVFGNLPAGAYAITIRDANQCTLVLPVQVNQPLLPLSSQIVQQVPLRCNGDTNACVTIAALLNSGTQPYRYIFNNDTLTSGLICNLSPGQYSARVLDANGCVYVQDINIANPPVVEAAFVEVKNVTCFAGADGMLKAQGSGGTPGTTPAPQYIYHWPGLPGNPLLPVVNGLSAQTYSMYVEDSFGCLSDTIYATLTQPEQLRTIAVGQTDICIGNSTTLTINATGGTPGYQILWFPNGITPVPPITGSPLTVQPTTTTNYLVQVSDSKNCRSLRDTIKITVHPLPTALFTVDPPVGCQGMCVSFSDISLISSTTGDVIERSHWVYGDNTFETQTNPTHCYQDAGNYNVRLVSETNYGCKDTVTLNNVIKVNPNPQVEFTFGPQPTSLVDPKIQFQIAELENNLYYWDLGDGTITTELNPLHTYKDTGKYCVKLRQISENGCPDSLIQCVVISPNFTMFIPSAFTPNGDLINDTFTVVSEYLSDYNIVIMDRWGQLVFASSSLDNQWDGIFKGDEAAEGVYTWVIRATDVTGKTYRKNGQVSLIR